MSLCVLFTGLVGLLNKIVDKLLQNLFEVLNFDSPLQTDSDLGLEPVFLLSVTRYCDCRLQASLEQGVLRLHFEVPPHRYISPQCPQAPQA